MKAYVLHGKEDLRLEDHPLPEVKAGQVLIKTRRVGVCGTDVHYFVSGRAGASIPKRPFIFGHEVVGEVVETGEGVEGLTAGTRIAIDPSQPCGNCWLCRNGRYNLCRTMAFLGSAKFDPPTHGANREYFTMPAANCYRLPDQLDDGQAAMLEPLSVAIQAVMRSGTVAGRSVMISGAGPIGQMILLEARAFGADTIAVSDVAEFPRQFAKKMGADFTLNAASDSIEKEVQRITPGGFDIVFEASGAPDAVRRGIDAVCYGGMLVQVGTLPATIELPFNMIMEKELQVLGSFRFAHVFPLALRQIAAGRINLTPLISKVFPFPQLPDALKAAQQKGDSMKVQIRFS